VANLGLCFAEVSNTRAYAEQPGKARTTLADKVKAYRVLAVTHVRHADIRDQWRHLAEIHARSTPVAALPFPSRNA
jgi:hypothetical protein